MATAQAKAALRAQRKQNGLCIHCGAKAVERQTRCQRCADRDKQNRKRYAARDIANGVCPRLGCQNLLPPGRSVCPACVQRNEAERKQRHSVRIKTGLCVICGAVAVVGQTKCQRHAANVREQTGRLRAERRKRGICVRCGVGNVMKGRRACEDCRNKTAQRRTGRKLTVLQAYGGASCVGCGEQEIAVLQIDHINGGGNDHARQIGNGNVSRGRGMMYQWLIENNFPPGFRVLCSNCNIRAHRKLPFPKQTQPQLLRSDHRVSR